MTACLAVLATLLASCGQTADQGGHTSGTEGVQILHYFTWSDYVGPEILAEFEQREQAKVIVDVFSSNEELLAKLQSGATGYDVAVPSDFMVAIMKQEGLLAELDADQNPERRTARRAPPTPAVRSRAAVLRPIFMGNGRHWV